MAARRRIFVSPDGARWKVQWEDGAVDTYQPTQSAAISIARGLVRALAAGQVSQIIVKRPDGTFREEWTYGKDPYPPVG